jgi:hypothetical protein
MNGVAQFWHSPGLVWKFATAFTLAIALWSIWDNGVELEQVCQTVQAQNDRNAATIQRSINGLELIAADPNEAVRTHVPGVDYYTARPEELEAALVRQYSELAIYQQQVC